MGSCEDKDKDGTCDYGCGKVFTVVYSEGLEFVSNGDNTCYVSDIGTCEDTELVIPPASPEGDRVTSIGDYAFYGCKNLTSVVIGDGVESIGEDAFAWRESLASVEIPDSVRSINDYAFAWCESLASVVIENGVTSIGNRVFAACDSLTSIKYRGTEDQWNVIEKDYNWDVETGDYNVTYEYDGE